MDVARGEAETFVERIPSPDERLGDAMYSLKTYSEALDRLEEVNVDLQFGVLDDVPADVEREVAKRSLYTQAIAEHYFGPNPEEHILQMNFGDYLRLARRMRKEVNLPAMLGEVRAISSAVSGFFQISRRKTIGKLEKAEIELNGVETTANRASMMAATPDRSGDSGYEEDPRAVLKAVKVFNGATKHVFPGETDFDILDELLSVSGILVLSQAAPYLTTYHRLALAKALFQQHGDPQAVKELFEKGKNWHIFLQSLRAPRTLVNLLKQHQNSYSDVIAAKARASGLTHRVATIHGTLRSVATTGIERHMDKAINALSELQQEDGIEITDVANDVVQYLFGRLRYIDDEDVVIGLGQRVEKLQAAA